LRIGLLMTLSIILLLSIIGLALILFSFEWLPADVIALGILLTLILTGLVPADEAFAGFGSDTVIMILGLFILTATLLRTGVVEMAGRTILRYTGDQPNRLLAVIMVASASLGAFISNTASTAFFVPIVLGLAERARISASKLLMPLAFSSILTSSVTLVSTSTNIVISGLMTQYGLSPMGMFELAPVGIPVAIVGLVYMFVIGRHLIPERSRPDDLIADFGSRLYFTEILIRPDSPLDGKTLAESGLGRDLDLKVLRLVRDHNRYLSPRADRQLQAGDVLLVVTQKDELLKIQETAGIDIQGDMQLSDPEFKLEDMQLVEAILLPRSPLIGRTLAKARFRERYELQVLAIYRHGETLHKKLSRTPLRVSDVLLIQAHQANVATITALEEENMFHVLGAVDEERPQTKQAPLAIAIFTGVLVIAALNLVSLAVAVMLGVLLAFLTGCITPERAYREVEWRALILIGCMLALGRAMEFTGAAEFLAAQIVEKVGTAQPVWLLTGFFILTVVLTQPMSNQAAAIVVVPVAMQMALQVGLNPRTFAMMIAVAASTSYLTPLEPSCLMVYGPGGYRFVDFLKVGSLLTVLIYVIAILLVPLIWPLS
jgi:di/tricarboxylate transporter